MQLGEEKQAEKGGEIGKRSGISCQPEGSNYCPVKPRFGDEPRPCAVNMTGV